MGWIRVVDNLFTVWKLDDQKMRHILSHINQNVMEEGQVELIIYEASTGRQAEFTDEELSSGMAAWNRKQIRGNLDLVNMYGGGEARM
jgi:hypothetical protein